MHWFMDACITPTQLAHTNCNRTAFQNVLLGCLAPHKRHSHGADARTVKSETPVGTIFAGTESKLPETGLGLIFLTHLSIVKLWDGVAR